MQLKIRRGIYALGALALLSAAFALIRTAAHFRSEPGGEYRGEIRGLGVVRASASTNVAGASIEICNEHAPNPRANAYLSGPSLAPGEVFKDSAEEVPFRARCTIASNALNGFIAFSNAPPAAFHLPRICGALGYRTKTGLSFRSRGCSFAFHGQIPELTDTPFTTAVTRFLMASVRAAETGDRADFTPDWRDYWHAWTGDYNSYLWDSDVAWHLVYMTDQVASLVCYHYNYSGGAHGNTGITTANFKWEDGKLQAIKLAELVRMNHLPVAELVQTIVADLKRQEASWPEEKTVAATVEAGTFTFDESGVSFYFSPYEVGSYAEGIYVSFIPWDRLGAKAAKRIVPHHL